MFGNNLTFQQFDILTIRIHICTYCIWIELIFHSSIQMMSSKINLINILSNFEQMESKHLHPQSKTMQWICYIINIYDSTFFSFQKNSQFTPPHNNMLMPRVTLTQNDLSFNVWYLWLFLSNDFLESTLIKNDTLLMNTLKRIAIDSRSFYPNPLHI